MSAIVWKKLKVFAPGAPPCEGRCLNDAKARGAAAYRMELCGWPAGYWCRSCATAMKAAWDSAHDPVEEPVAA